LCPVPHTGTFRVNNLAFVAATEALRYWEDDSFAESVAAKGAKLERHLKNLVNRHPGLQGTVCGRGLLQGIRCETDGLAGEICAIAFEMGLLMETSGANGEVVKIMPPLVTDDVGLERGLGILGKATEKALARRRLTAKSVA
jgi:diaminobutyrate-2-oxoglutarate transaminase